VSSFSKSRNFCILKFLIAGKREREVFLSTFSTAEINGIDERRQQETEHWCKDTNVVELKYTDKICPSAYMGFESVMLGHL
jgi:hypothetical protein